MSKLLFYLIWDQIDPFTKEIASVGTLARKLAFHCLQIAIYRDTTIYSGLLL